MSPKEISSITITPGYLDHTTEYGSNYVIPYLEDGKFICFKHKFLDNKILPEPFEKIFIEKKVGEGLTEISVVDATKMKDHKKYFKIFLGDKPEEDLFSGLENSQFFKPADQK